MIQNYYLYKEYKLKTVKKYISILLIFTTIAPIWLFISLIRYEKYIVRKEIKKAIVAGIDKNELVFLRFSKEEVETELKWEHSKEFEYLDEMYDVVESQIRGDSIYYWCWWDYKETKLNKQLDQLVKYATSSDRQSKERTEKLQNLVTLFYFDKTFTLYDFNINESKNIFSRYSINYTTRSISPDTPPPRT